MDSDSQDIRVYYNLYNQEGSAIISRLFNKFLKESEHLDREADENVFQLLRGKYRAVLKERLEQNAYRLIEECRFADMRGRLRISFTEKISYLMKEFTRKTNSL